MTDFTMTTDADGVATITWDVASKSMNVMSTEAFMALSRAGRSGAGRCGGEGDHPDLGQEGLCRGDGPERHRADAGGGRAGDL